MSGALTPHAAVAALLLFSTSCIGCSRTQSSGQEIAVPDTAEAPTSVGGIFRRGATAGDRALLAVWAEHRALDPALRYAALRRLEELEPAAALEVAGRLLGDPVALVARNALAVIAASDSPAAARFISGLEPSEQELVSELRRARERRP